MSQFGSSRIPEVVPTIALDQFIGSTGATGNAGATGPSVAGLIGNTGRSIISIMGVSSDAIKILYTEGNGTTLTNIQPRPSQDGGTFDIRFIGEGDNRYYALNHSGGYTLFFKSIEVLGNVTASYSTNDLVIKGLTLEYAGSFTPNTLIYIGITLSSSNYNLQSTNNTLYYRESVSGATYDSLEVLFSGFSENGVVNNLNYNTDGTFVPQINSSFYHFEYSNPNTSKVRAFLRYNVNYATTSSSAAASEKITFKDFELYNRRIDFSSTVGSCCYCDAISSTNRARLCVEYVNKNYCENSLSGSWSPSPCFARYNTDDCYGGGACCVNGRCISCSKEKCLAYGGEFAPNQNCSSIGECPDSCVFGCCCIDGKGYAMSEQFCDLIERARFFPEGCSLINCCEVGHVGACCVRKTCFDNFTARECGDTGGVFQGTNTVCASQFIDCCKSPV